MTDNGQNWIDPNYTLRFAISTNGPGTAYYFHAYVWATTTYFPMSARTLESMLWRGLNIRMKVIGGTRTTLSGASVFYFLLYMLFRCACAPASTDEFASVRIWASHVVVTSGAVRYNGPFLLLQLSQTRTASSQPRDGTGRLWVEHWSQAPSPHARQWCSANLGPNLAAQTIHDSIRWSDTQ